MVSILQQQAGKSSLVGCDSHYSQPALKAQVNIASGHKEWQRCWAPVCIHHGQLLLELADFVRKRSGLFLGAVFIFAPESAYSCNVSFSKICSASMTCNHSS